MARPRSRAQKYKERDWRKRNGKSRGKVKRSAAWGGDGSTPFSTLKSDPGAATGSGNKNLSRRQKHKRAKFASLCAIGRKRDEHSLSIDKAQRKQKEKPTTKTTREDHARNQQSGFENIDNDESKGDRNVSGANDNEDQTLLVTSKTNNSEPNSTMKSSLSSSTIMHTTNRKVKQRDYFAKKKAKKQSKKKRAGGKSSRNRGDSFDDYILTNDRPIEFGYQAEAPPDLSKWQK
eukprot:g3600.t1